MSLDLGELVGSLRMDTLPWDQALSKADRSMAAFGAGAKSTAKGAGDDATAGLASGLDGMGAEARAAGSDAVSNLDGALAAAESTAKAAGGDAGSSFGDAFKSSSKDVGKAGGAALGGAIAVGIADNMSVEAGLNKVAVQLGLGKEQMKVAGQVAGDIYANNFGEDLPDINEAMAGVIRNMNIDVNDVNLQPITEKVLTVRDAFDQDLGMTTAAVGQMIRTGMVKDAQEGLDVLTAGLQSPANKADDLAETMNEYGTQFRKLGLDGRDAMGLLSQGLQGGARDADIVADALKEFSLKTQESTTQVTKLSDGTSALSTTPLGDAFEAVGVKVLTADGKLHKAGMTLQNDLAKGGEKGRAALDKVLDGLQKIDDPAKRTRTAVALFGTQAEDMGDALLNLDLDSASQELGKVEGAADKAVDTMGSGAQATIDSYGRKLVGMGRDAIEAMGPIGSVGGAIVGILPAVASVVGPVVGSWLAMSGASLAGAASMASAWLLAIWPIALVIAAVVAVVVIVVKNWDTIKEKTVEAWDWVVSKTVGAWDSVVGTIKDKGGAAIDWVKSMPGKAIDALGNAGQTLKAKGKDLIEGWKEGASEKWDAVKSWFSNAPDRVITAVGGVARTLAEKGKDLFQGLRDGAGEKWDAVVGWFQNAPERVVNAVGGVARTLAEKGKDLIQGLRDGAGEKWDAVVGWVQDTGTRVSNAVGNLGSLLKDAGIAIVQGLIDGIEAKFQALKDKVGAITNWVKDHKGPKSYDLTLWRGPGNWIMQGLMDGFDDQMPALDRKVSQVTDSIASTPMPTLVASVAPTIPESAEVAAHRAQQGGTTVTNNWNIDGSKDPEATAAEVSRRQSLAGVG